MDAGFQPRNGFYQCCPCLGQTATPSPSLLGGDLVKAIGGAVGKYIDKCEPKENMHACTKICVEVDLGKGLP